MGESDFLLNRGIYGLLGLISLDSRSYVEGTNKYDISDTDGHGTSMASIYSGFEHTNKLIEEHPLLPQSVNMATHSELVVLKCMRDDDGSVHDRFDAMLKALDYAASIKLDVLYIGIGFTESDVRVRQIPPLERRLRKMKETHNSIVICPAGNYIPDLAFPAASITSVNFSIQTFKLNSHSAYSK